MQTITYEKGKIAVTLLAEPIAAAKATSKYMANYLRDKLMNRVVLDSRMARVIAIMTDEELVAAYASYQEQKYAKVTIIK